MRPILYILCILSTGLAFAQEKDQEKKEKTNEQYHIYQGNEQLRINEFANAEAEYREAIDENPANPTARYNLGNAYYKHGKSDEALLRFNQAQGVAKTKAEKHRAYHNMGNSFMQQKKYEPAVEAYKNALRNNPKDDETRYNLALAKKMLENNKDPDNKNDKNKNNKKNDQDNQDQKESDQKDKDGKNDQEDKKGDKDDKKEGEDDKKDQDPNEKDGDKDNDKKEGDKQEPKDQKDKQPKPQEGQLTPQQMQQLLNAMDNEEKKVQEKLNKKKGVIIKTEKDW